MPQPAGAGGATVTEKGTRLVANLADYLTRRKHVRSSGMYLPLVRVDVTD